MKKAFVLLMAIAMGVSCIANEDGMGRNVEDLESLDLGEEFFLAETSMINSYFLGKPGHGQYREYTLGEVNVTFDIFELNRLEFLHNLQDRWSAIREQDEDLLLLYFGNDGEIGSTFGLTIIDWHIRTVAYLIDKVQREEEFTQLERVALHIAVSTDASQYRLPDIDNE